MDPNDWTLTGNAGIDPTTNFLGTIDNNPLIIKTNGTDQLRVYSGGKGGPNVEITGSAAIDNALAIGNIVGFAPSPNLTVAGPDATVNVETAEILRVMRHGVGGVKNQNSAGLFVGAFESGINGRSRLDINVAGTPGPSNTFGSVPDVTVMSLLGDGSVGIGTTGPSTKLEVDGQTYINNIGDGGVNQLSFNERGTNWGHFYGDSNNRLYFGASNTLTTVPSSPIMTWDLGTGNVGIGTSNPIAQLQVIRTSRIGAAVHAVSSGDGGTGIHAAGKLNAGDFSGNVAISGDLFVVGNKQFKIDHPLDAAKKYLYHASVESPEMKNIYDGVVVLDARGEAEVTLPAWFDALNTDFRYQLTAIGAAGPELYIAKEISANRFKIAGGKPTMKVCWQVTGIRHDVWAKAHPLLVEQDKPAQEQGYYLHPELYGESDEKSIVRAHYPELEIPVLPKK